jgi:hypothetical protein
MTEEGPSEQSASHRCTERCRDEAWGGWRRNGGSSYRKFCHAWIKATGGKVLLRDKQTDNKLHPLSRFDTRGQ